MKRPPPYRLQALLDLRKTAEEHAARELAKARSVRNAADEAVRESKTRLEAVRARIEGHARADRSRESAGRRVGEAVAADAFRDRLEREREALEEDHAELEQAAERARAAERAAQDAVVAATRERKAIEKNRDAVREEARRRQEREEEAEAEEALAPHSRRS